MRRQQSSNSNNSSTSITQELPRTETIPDITVVRERLERSNFIEHNPIIPRNSNRSSDTPINTTSSSDVVTPLYQTPDTIPEEPHIQRLPYDTLSTELQNHLAQRMPFRRTYNQNNNNTPSQPQPVIEVEDEEPNPIPNNLNEHDRITLEQLNNLWQQ